MKKLLSFFLLLPSLAFSAGPIFAPTTNGVSYGPTSFGPVTNRYPGNLLEYHMNTGVGAIAERARWVDKVGGQNWDFYALGDDMVTMNRWMGLVRTGSVPMVSKIEFDRPVEALGSLTASPLVSNTAAIMVNRTGKIMIAATNAGGIPANDTGYIVIGSGQTTNGTGGNIVFPDRGGIWGPQGAGVYFWSDHGAGQPLVIVQGGDIDLIPGEALALQIGATGGGESTRKYLQYSTYDLDNANPLGWSSILEGRALSWNGATYASATHTPGLGFRAANTNDASKLGQFTLWLQSPEWAVGNHTAVPTTAGVEGLTGHPVNGLTMGSTLDVAYGPSWSSSLRIPSMGAIYAKIESVIAAGGGIPTLDGIGTNTIIWRTTGLDPEKVFDANFCFLYGAGNVLVMDGVDGELFSPDTGVISLRWLERLLHNSAGDAVADWSGANFNASAGARLGTIDFQGGGVTLGMIDDDGRLERYDGSSITTLGTIGYSPSITRTVWNKTSNTGNSGTTETTLQSFELSTVTDLNIDNQKLVSHWSVNTVGSGTATRRIKIYCGSTGTTDDEVLYDSGEVTLATSGLLMFETVIHRVGNTSMRVTTTLNTPTASSYPYTAYVSSTSVDFDAATFVIITGEADGVGAASDDIVVVQGYGEVKP